MSDRTYGLGPWINPSDKPAIPSPAVGDTDCDKDDSEVIESEWTQYPQLISMDYTLNFLSDIQASLNIIQRDLDKFKGEMIAIKQEVQEKW